MTILYFIGALMAYYALHSILAADGVKAILGRIVSPRYYRLAFNVQAALLFAAVFFLYFLVDKAPLWTPNQVPHYLAGAVLVLFGTSWIVRALKRYNLDEFMGLEQLRPAPRPGHQKLITRGPNGRVRHPLYFGTLLVAWGVLFLFPTDAMLAFALITTIYLIIGTRLEEEKLVVQFGEAYRKYQRAVPMLVPFRWKRFRRI